MRPDRSDTLTMRVERVAGGGAAEAVVVGVPGVATEDVSAACSEGASAAGVVSGACTVPLVLTICAKGASDVLEALDIGDAGLSIFTGDGASSAGASMDMGGCSVQDSDFGFPGVSGSTVGAFDDEASMA